MVEPWRHWWRHRDQKGSLVLNNLPSKCYIWRQIDAIMNVTWSLKIPENGFGLDLRSRSVTNFLFRKDTHCITKTILTVRDLSSFVVVRNRLLPTDHSLHAHFTGIVVSVPEATMKAICQGAAREWTLHY